MVKRKLTISSTILRQKTAAKAGLAVASICVS